MKQEGTFLKVLNILADSWKLTIAETTDFEQPLRL
jgi:hypothetical protein